MLLVSSSTNSGTPSALPIMCSMTSEGTALPFARCPINASTSGRSRRLRVIGVMCECIAQGGMNSGRYVSTFIIETVGDCSM